MLETMSSEAQRRIATESNNAAWDLIEKADLTSDDCVELIRLAGTAFHHWSEIGTAGNIAHADLLFSWALAGAGVPSVGMARRALAYFTDTPSQDWEKAFAHAAMAMAYQAAGDPEGHRKHYDQARVFERGLEAGDLKVFGAAFRNVPRP